MQESLTAFYAHLSNSNMLDDKRFYLVWVIAQIILVAALAIGDYQRSGNWSGFGFAVLYGLILGVFLSFLIAYIDWSGRNTRGKPPHW